MDDADILSAAAGGYAPLAAGFPARPFTGFEGLPLPGGPAGAALGLALPAWAGPAMARAGLTPYGLGHGRNLYDVYRSRLFVEQQDRAVRAAAEEDRRAADRLVGGLYSLAGVPLTPQVRRQIAATTAPLPALAPLLARFPGAAAALETLGGSSGSAAVLAQRVAEAGRYRVDPATGRLGVSGDDAGRAAAELYREFFAPGADRAAAAGFGAGRLGELYAQLGARGALPGGPPATALADRAGPDALAAAARRQGLDPGRLSSLRPAELDRLLADPGLEDTVRAVDADRVKRTLKGYAKAVAAVRDIFGQAGRADAPMAELVGALDALTAGGVGRADPEALARQARQTYNLARATGVGLDNLFLLQNRAGQTLAAVGADPALAADATRAGLAAGGAARGLGLFAAANPQALSADRFQLAVTDLAARGAGSDAVNRVAAVSRLLKARGDAAPGSDAGRFLAALAAGEAEFTDAAGRRRSVAVSDAEAAALVGDEGAYRTAVLQKAENQAEVAAAGTAGLALDLQAAEFRTAAGEAAARAGRDQLAGLLRRAGDPRAAETARAAGDRFGARVRELAAAGRFAGTEADTAAALAEALGEAAPGLAAADRRAAAEAVRGELNRATAVRFPGFKGLADASRAYGDPARAQARRQERQAAADAGLQEALAPLARNPLGATLVDALAGVDPADPDALKRAALTALGGVGGEEVAAAVGPAVRDVVGREKALAAAYADADRIADPAARRARLDDLNRQRDDLRQAADRAAKLVERHAGGPDGRAADQAAAARAALAAADAGRAALTGFDSQAAARVHPSITDRLVREPGTLTEAEAFAVARGLPGLDTPAARTAKVRELLDRGRPGTPAEAELLERVRRQALPLAADDRAVAAAARDEAARTGRPVTPAQARALANLRLAAGRAGVSVADALAQAGPDPEAGIAALRAAVEAAAAAAPADPAAAGRLGAALSAPGGAPLLDAAARAEAGLDATARSLLSDPAATDRLGGAAVPIAEGLIARRRRREALADEAAGGSLERLRAGGLDPAVPADRRAAVAAELARLDALDRADLDKVAAGRAAADPALDAARLAPAGPDRDALAAGLKDLYGLDPAQRAAVRDAARTAAAPGGADRLRAAAAAAGLDEPRARAAAAAADRLEEEQAAARARADEGPRAVADRVLRAYGADDKAATPAGRDALAAALADPDRARLADRAARGREDLARRFGAGRAADAAREYAAAGTAADRAAVLARLGLPEADRAAAGAALDAERAAGLSRLSLAGPGDPARAAAAALGRAEPAPGPAADARGPQRISGQLTVHFDGRPADFVGQWGSSADFSTPDGG